MKLVKKLIALVMAIGMITINCMAYAAAPADSSEHQASSGGR